MTRQRVGGFTLMEVSVAALIIGVVMVGMSTILINYSSTRSKMNNLQTAHNIAESELDDVLMHSQIEADLISDTKGRARPVMLL